jgi:DNA-binding NarL/FixJ family response regulator
MSPLTATLPGPRTAMEEGAAAPWRSSSVLVVDPDQMTRDSLRKALVGVGISRVREATSLEQVRELAANEPGGDLALVSLALGSGAGSAVVALRAAGWSRVVALAPTADIGPVIDAVGSGVHGVLIGRRANPAAANVPSAIHELSAREVEVIQLVADGRSNKYIGDKLSLSALTVKSHLARIGRKLGTGDRAHIVALALRAGVVS